jgi:hypothetical protein
LLRGARGNKGFSAASASGTVSSVLLFVASILSSDSFGTAASVLCFLELNRASENMQRVAYYARAFVVSSHLVGRELEWIPWLHSQTISYFADFEVPPLGTFRLDSFEMAAAKLLRRASFSCMPGF